MHAIAIPKVDLPDNHSASNNKPWGSTVLYADFVLEAGIVHKEPDFINYIHHCRISDPIIMLREPVHATMATAYPLLPAGQLLLLMILSLKYHLTLVVTPTQYLSCVSHTLEPLTAVSKTSFHP